MVVDASPVRSVSRNPIRHRIARRAPTRRLRASEPWWCANGGFVSYDAGVSDVVFNLVIIQRMVSDLESSAKYSIVHDFVVTWDDLEKIGHHTFYYNGLCLRNIPSCSQELL